MPEVVLRNVAAERYARDAGEVVMQARPEARIDNLVAEVIRHVEVVHSVQVPGRASGVEAVDVKIETLGGEEVGEDFGDRKRDRAMRGGVFRMVRRRQERPPAQLLERLRVAIVIARYGTKTIGPHRRRVDGSDRPPEQIVV